ncbi:MAG TPA: hypothetical protein VIK12_07600 [Pengzhenrongella sp.]
MTVVAIAPLAQVPVGVVAISPDTGDVLEALRTRQPGQSVLVVASDRSGLEAARRARLALDDGSFGLVLCDIPPTLFFLTAAALADLPSDGFALAPMVVQSVSRGTRTTALISSVTGLERPRPSVSLDVVSLLPRTTFVVDWQAQQVRSGDPDEFGPAESVVVSRSERPVSPVDERLWPESRLELKTDGTFWGARRWMETTTLTAPLGALVDAVLRDEVVSRLPSCPSCRRLVGGDTCVFCQLLVSGGHA